MYRTMQNVGLIKTIQLEYRVNTFCLVFKGVLTFIGFHLRNGKQTKKEWVGQSYLQGANVHTGVWGNL